MADQTPMPYLPQPFDYAHRYHGLGGGTVIRFGTHGRELNGCMPLEAIPLFTKEQIASAITDVVAREREAHRPMMQEMRFLLERLAELEIPEELQRDWDGHVAPTAARLDMVLSDLEAAAIRARQP